MQHFLQLSSNFHTILNFLLIHYKGFGTISGFSPSHLL
nr:MAG TPA: hypothetical protein [Herelleviridae sp.]